MQKFRINKDGYLMTGKASLVHRLIWETQHGDIPDGYHIHHVDGNRQNNCLSNLQCLSHSEHLSLHMKANSSKVHAWHKTEIGRKFLGEKAKKTWKEREEHTLKCKQCGNDFHAKQIDRATYCDNKCEQAARRARGDDLVDRECVICLKTFSVNKYYKTVTCGYACGSKYRTRFAKGKRHSSKPVL